MTPQRITLVTLGTRDLNAARAFYARLGWREHGAQEGVGDHLGLLVVKGGLTGLHDQPFHSAATASPIASARVMTGMARRASAASGFLVRCA